MAFSCVNLGKSDLLKRCKEYYFSTGMDDGASRLAQINTAYGLSKIHYAQEKLGFLPNAFFVSTPDETITRNAYRWAWGSGYGGKYCWGDGSQKIIFPDMKPNSCGMITGALDYEPEIKDIINNVDNLMHDDSIIDGIPIKWDFKDSNHFIDVFKLKIPKTNENEKLINKISEYEYFFIMHCSAPEYKNILPGMYIDQSRELYDMCEHISTPFGQCNALIDSNAQKYYDFLQKANKFSIDRRQLAAEKIFGKGFELISNQNHQGMIKNMNEMHLGANDSLESEITPIALNADAPAYLVHGLPNFTKEMIEKNGWKERAQKLGIKKFLKNSNIMPHGGGYALNGILKVNDVELINGEKFFTCGTKSISGSNFAFKNPKELEFHYRGKEVVHKAIEKGLCEKLAVLEPYIIIKL